MTDNEFKERVESDRPVDTANDDLETAAEVTPAIGNNRNFPPQVEGSVTYREVDNDDRRMGNMEDETRAIGNMGFDEDKDRDVTKSMQEEEVDRGTSTLGWTSLVLSIVSLFIFPVVLSSAGIVTGFLAYRQGDRTLGTWSMIVGGLALLMALFYNPFIR